jgi:hypothetical protein
MEGILYGSDTIRLVPSFFKERKECVTVDGDIGGEKVVLHSFRIVMDV